MTIFNFLRFELIPRAVADRFEIRDDDVNDSRQRKSFPQKVTATSDFDIQIFKRKSLVFKQIYTIEH